MKEIFTTSNKINFANLNDENFWKKNFRRKKEPISFNLIDFNNEFVFEKKNFLNHEIMVEPNKLTSTLNENEPSSSSFFGWRWTQHHYHIVNIELIFLIFSNKIQLQSIISKKIFINPHLQCIYFNGRIYQLIRNYFSLFNESIFNEILIQRLNQQIDQNFIDIIQPYQQQQKKIIQWRGIVLFTFDVRWPRSLQ